MGDAGAEDLGDRVLVLAPTARDAGATRSLLADAGVRSFVCGSIADVCREAVRGAGACLVTAEAVAADSEGLLAALLRSQPSWSDLPLIVLTPPGDDSPHMVRRLEAVGPMTLMKRPVQVASLVSAVRSALRDRRRQYAVRDFVDERERYRVTLSSIGDGVIATDTGGRVTFLNSVAEQLTRWDAAAARGRPLGEVFNIVNETTRVPVPNPALRALSEGVIVGLANHTVLIARDGGECPIDDSAAPIRGEDGAVIGAVLVFRDITEKKEAERAIRERERQAAAILESISDGFFAVNREWRFTYANARAEQILAREPNDLIGLVLWDEYPGLTGSPLEAMYHRVAATGVPESATVFYPDHDRWYAAHAYPAPDGISVYFGDVTVQQQAEERLRESEEQRLAALDAAELGAWRLDIATATLTTDARFRAIFGITDGRDDYEAAVGFIHIEDRARVRAAVEAAARPDFPAPYEIEYRIVRPDGSIRWVFAKGRTNVQSGRAGGPFVSLDGTVADVTARKEADQELSRVTADSERRKRLYETALSNTPDLVYVFDLDHRFAYANEALLKMWGRTWDEAIGRSCLELGYEGWHASMHDAEIEQVRATKKPIRGDVPFTGTGGRRTYDYIFVPVFGADGEVEAVAGTTRDVTDRQAMEQELRDQDRKKDEFIALLAHELRNPLAPIRNGLQVVRLSDDRATRERTQAMMERQLTHMVRLIDDLLDVSRIERNKMELRRGRVALADVVGSAVETAGPLVEDAAHALSVSLPPGPVFLDADLTRLAQVFSNLLTNSAKYTPRGGKIWLTGRVLDGKVVVSVRDTGIGIPTESLSHIFDMFSQVDRSTERSTGGLGIGLALVKGLVEMHGGTVTAASGGQGQGSEFTVTLPALGAPSAVADPAPEGAPLEAGVRRRILVVDDNRDGAESLAMMLGMIGNEVALAHDGLEAVEQARLFRPDVVLMDVGMPRLNGLEATQRIRAEGWGQGMTIIALTGWGQDGDRQQSRDAGCDGHLVKPVNLPDLEKMLGELHDVGAS